MKFKSGTAALALAASVAMTSAVALTSPAAAATTLDQIAARLEALEKENAALRSEVETLKAKSAAAPVAAAPVVASGSAPTGLITASGEAVVTAESVAVAAANDPHKPAVGLTFSAGAINATTGVGDTGFVTNSPVTSTAPSGQTLNAEFDEEAAYRIGANYEFPSHRSVGVTYTHLGEDTSSSVAGSFLWATVGRADLASSFENYAGTASSSLDLSHDRIDLLFSEPIKMSGAEVSILYGIEYAKIDLDQSYTFVSGATTGVVAGSSSVKGVGPQIGFDVDYEIFSHEGSMPGALSITALTTGSLLYAQADSSAFNSITGSGTILNVSNNSERLVPVIHLRLGLNYEAEIARTLATFELGYEVNSYIGGITGTVYPDDVADGLSSASYQNFDMSGPYVSAKFKF